MMLWSWGANSHGQLSLGYVNEQVENPTKIDTDFIWSNIKQIACGGAHTVLVDNEDKIYSCGWNYKLQLGIDGKDKELLNFTRIWPLSGINFINIACGWDFSCGVTDDHFMFVWGCNSFGQLGLPKDQFPECVKPIRLHVNACAVDMGLRHTAIINSKGEVWVTGCGKHGQLGLGKEILNSEKFLKVPKLGKISHIACGQNHTIAWSAEERVLYVWGDNRHGQLLLSTEKYPKLFLPEKIDIDVKQNVRKLLSGWTNVLLWLEDDSLLTWGRNNYGQLGTFKPFVGRIIHIELPGRREVKDVCLGSEHTICLATDNTLWAWGWNEHANTGTKKEPHQPWISEPTQVPIDICKGSKVTKIFAGGAHNFIITEEQEGLENR